VATSERRPSAQAIRKQLSERLPRWHRDLESEHQFRGTLGMGIGMGAVALVERLLRLATQELLPDVALRKKPAIGDYVNALASSGQERKLDCSDPSRSLVTSADLELLREFARCRAEVAHQADRDLSAEPLGRVAPNEVRRLLTLSERVVALPLVEELVCRERRFASMQFGPDLDG
jgi:hypothetical protein